MLRDVFVNILIAPYFQLALLTDMKHALKYLKVAITLVQQFETLQGHHVTMKRISERNVVDFGQIGDSSLIIDLEVVYSFGTVFLILDVDVLRGYQVGMLVASIKSLQFAIDIVLVVYLLSKLHHLFTCFVMPVDGKRFTRVDKAITAKRRSIGR